MISYDVFVDCPKCGEAFKVAVEVVAYLDIDPEFDVGLPNECPACHHEFTISEYEDMWDMAEYACIHQHADRATDYDEGD